MSQSNELEKLDEEIRQIREQLEQAACRTIDEGKSLGDDANILRQSMYLDELILTEQHLRTAMELQEEKEDEL